MLHARKIAIVGGGAAGFFGAIRCAEVAKEYGLEVEVVIFESSSQFLKKVRISGGGRCNVTHNCFDVRTLVQNYPRGHRELISPMQRFQPKDTLDWFEKRGVKIVAEEDGRMFPETNSSETIIDCFKSEVERLGIEVRLKNSVKSLSKIDGNGFELQFGSRSLASSIESDESENFIADRLLIATGSSPAGYKFAESLGHKITERAPSLFSFKIESRLLDEMSGISFGNTKLRLKIADCKEFKQNGPTLITHWGLSGPAILKLSAWAAREMKNGDYRAKLIVNWLGREREEEVVGELKILKESSLKSLTANSYPSEIPKRFWIKLLRAAEVLEDKRWADVSKKEIFRLSNLLFSCEFEILGKNRFKDEFVECGGVSLREINFKTFQSRIHPEVYFAGELLDVDGITGGFNFQNAWTTSWIAGEHMVLSLKEDGNDRY